MLVICEKAKSCRRAGGTCEHQKPHEFSRLWFMDCPGNVSPCERGKRPVQVHCVPVRRRA